MMTSKASFQVGLNVRKSAAASFTPAVLTLKRPPCWRGNVSFLLNSISFHPFLIGKN